MLPLPGAALCQTQDQGIHKRSAVSKHPLKWALKNLRRKEKRGSILGSTGQMIVNP